MSSFTSDHFSAVLHCNVFLFVVSVNYLSCSVYLYIQALGGVLYICSFSVLL
jgi:hypothetical protein